MLLLPTARSLREIGLPCTNNKPIEKARSNNRSTPDLHVTFVFGTRFSATFFGRCVATFAQKSGPHSHLPEEMKYVVADGYSDDDDCGMVYDHGDRALTLLVSN
jgi:hypothetical protein